MKKSIPWIVLIAAVVLIFAVYNVFSGNSGASDSRPGGSGVNDTTHDPIYKVVLDPGHGGKDRGATGASGQDEKDFTLQLSHKVRERLEQEPQIEVYMTRTDDSFISSIDRERPEFANQLNADVFLSIHGNTFTDAGVSGTETYYYREESLQLAEIMHKHTVEATGFRDRGVKKENFFVVKDTTMPAVLLEVGYLTNPQDEAQLLKDEVQNRIAGSIVAGIKEYLNIQ
ncbi:hypothetical protein PAE9249_05307 [Paenibacillus sp. CECT 9249]|uniref:N-acetylmuramoyl-L-alanine amidase family protein n=1 Tax=Paenibacillus sp. CECT 9249 TaxID=2845385 RepID=UPI001E3A16A6|nr:N-acetylmuramoyl-L-alanine amidase [Paenibacillus sp. CECT 9249]CAH0122718.1 hypothetical protein PAE9249_05307 [Paenibacillus sp. CECT 9249]